MARFALSMPDLGRKVMVVRHIAELTNPPKDADMAKVAFPTTPAGGMVDDVTRITGIQVGWVRAMDGSFSPYEESADELRAQQRDTIANACRNAIIGGFSSSALGAAHVYDASDQDQTNIAQDCLEARAAGDDAKWSASLTCTNRAGVKASRPHDSKQVMQVASDLRTARVAAQEHKRELLDKLGRAQTPSDVRKVVW